MLRLMRLGKPSHAIWFIHVYSVCVYVYIYTVYIYIYTVYTYIYIHTQQSSPDHDSVFSDLVEGIIGRSPKSPKFGEQSMVSCRVCLQSSIDS